MNKLEVKDLINIGLFSVLGFVFMMIGSFLFTGDAGIETEPRLDPQAIDVDVLKVGHHGSASATSAVPNSRGL